LKIPVESITAKGTFGDGEVPVHIFRPRAQNPGSPLVVLLHGVHGCAGPEPGNKYGELARMLSSAGITCAVTETSRTRRDRETFGTDREGWARAAFTGKTFLEDHADAIAGTEAAAAAVGTNNIWVFGFSLGGIHTVLASGEKGGFSFKPSGIALGGVGSIINPEASSSLSLPILETVPPEKTLIEAAARLRTGKVVSFYGSLDATFPEDSCRRLVEAVPLPCERKRFIVMEGVDHAFRSIRGIPSIKPLEMISRVMALSVF